MNSQIIELKVIHPNLNLDIKVSDNETILEVRETIMNLYNYKNIRSFELFLDGLHLNEFYDQYLIRFFFNKLELRKLHVLKSSQIQLHESSVKQQMETLFKINDELCLQNECEQIFGHSVEDMKLLEINLQSYLKELEDKLKIEEVFMFPKTDDSKPTIFDQIEKFENIMKNKQSELESRMHQLFLCRKKEQKALKQGKLNKEAVNELNVLESALKALKDKIFEMRAKENYIRKQKKIEASYINNFMVSKKKMSSLESIKLRFSKMYKYSVILKLINEKTILAFHKYSFFEENKEGRLEIRNIIDQGSFGEIYYQQSKRDEFFLNYKENLFIAIKNNVFIYQYKTNQVFQLPSMTDDHKGGSFVYVPGNNSVYCISGLISVLTERLHLDFLDNFLEKKEGYKIEQWKVTTKTKSPRSYYSVCVIDSFIIYIILGFDLLRGEFLSSFEKYDTSKPEENWVNIKILSEKPIKLTFSGVIVTSDEECYILGGKDEHNNDNTCIYLLDFSQRTIEDSEMRLPIPPGIEPGNIDNKNLFYQESSFLPLQTDPKNDNVNSMFYLCCFDSKNFLHRVNIKTFDYSFIHQELEGGNNIVESQSISQISNKELPEIENKHIKGDN